MEIAYEISWSEAKDLLEVLEIRRELDRRNRLRQKAQTA